MTGADNAAMNTDVDLWREPYDDSVGSFDNVLFVTKHGGIGIRVAGIVYVKPLREWHALAMKADPPPDIRMLEQASPSPSRETS